MEDKASTQETLLNEYQVIDMWKDLAFRNDWRLIENPYPFVCELVTSLRSSHAGTITPEKIKIALARSYSKALFRKFTDREERAVIEVYSFCMRVAMRLYPRDREDAEDIVQETLERVWGRLHHLRHAESFTPWIAMILRTVHRSRYSSFRMGISLTSDIDVIDPSTDVENVDQEIINEQLAKLIQSMLTNHLERTILLHIMINGDKPRDIARDLQVPLNVVRVAKYRALQRLRDNEVFMDLLANLHDDTSIDQSKNVLTKM